jgi:hypothetical protein
LDKAKNEETVVDHIDTHTEDSELPACTRPDFQELFKAIVSFISKEKHVPWNVAVEQGHSVIAQLTGHLEQPVHYSELRELTQSLLQEQKETAVETAAAVKAVAQLLASRGVGRLPYHQDILHLVVEHFFAHLQIQPRIEVRVSRAVGRRQFAPPLQSVSSKSARSSLDDDDWPTAATGSIGEEESCWFTELLNTEPSATARTNWSEFSLGVPRPPERESQPAGSFEELERHFQRMIRYCADKKVPYPLFFSIKETVPSGICAR